MLKRTLIRRYWLALLCSKDAYQTPGCETGPLWTNCNNEPIDIYDSATHQIGEDNHAPYSVASECAAVSIRIDSDTGTLTPGRFQDNQITFDIDIYVNHSSGHERQNMLDDIQCRILYRLINTPKITDVNTDDVYQSPICMALRNEVRLNVRDDSEAFACYTIRTLTFTLDVRECILSGNCNDKPLCFDFDNLTVLNKDAPDVFVTDIEDDADD